MCCHVGDLEYDRFGRFGREGLITGERKGERKPVEENMRISSWSCSRRDFFEMTQALTGKGKMDQLDFIKMKTFIRRHHYSERQAEVWEKTHNLDKVPPQLLKPVTFHQVSIKIFLLMIFFVRILLVRFLLGTWHF